MLTDRRGTGGASHKRGATPQRRTSVGVAVSGVYRQEAGQVGNIECARAASAAFAEAEVFRLRVPQHIDQALRHHRPPLPHHRKSGPATTPSPAADPVPDDLRTALDDIHGTH
ncbi:hypothetical protein [Plantactinospora sp. DSM 117369]